MKAELFIGIVVGWVIGEFTSKEVGSLIALALIALLFIENNFTFRKKNRPRKPKPFTVIHTCVNCGEELEDRFRCLNNGVCPFCGHVTKGTICDTIKTSGE